LLEPETLAPATYLAKVCGKSPLEPEEKLTRAILKDAVCRSQNPWSRAMRGREKHGGSRFAPTFRNSNFIRPG
jgi:hypothetical protein